MNTEKAYVSTRGGPAVSYGEAVMAGFARNNKGLYVPEHFPRMQKDKISLFYANQPTYSDTMFEWTWPFVDGIKPGDYKKIITSAFHRNVWGDDPAPIVKINDKLSVFELFHGPSGAFKDHPMQPVAREFEYLLALTNRKIIILVATSGDTGPAAIEAFRGLKNVLVVVFFPKNGTSSFQRKQMTAMATKNIFVIAVDGSFDDCQAIVKELGNRRDLVEALCLSGVNSINWGRIKYQIGYYPYAWSKVAANDTDVVTFIVPTGNFGNVFAGFGAMRMGLPIRLVMATNSNHVLVDFFRDGIYTPWKDEIKTMSPSMNITKASNIERLIFWLTDDDADRTRAYMEQVEREGSFKLEKRHFERLRACGIVADFANDNDCVVAMGEVHDKYGYIMDPHTAVAYVAWKRLAHDAHRSVIMSTAAPYKFVPAVSGAIHAPVPRPLRFAGFEDRPDASNVVYLSKNPDDAERYLREVVAKAA